MAMGRPMFPVLVVVMAVAGCGGGGGDGGGSPDGGALVGEELANPSVAIGATGADLTAFPTQLPIGASGGTLVLPGGPSLAIPAGALAETVRVAIRPAAAVPTVGAPGYAVLSSWFDLATNVDTTAVHAGVIALDVPATPPSTAVGHPGLQLLAVVNGATLPIDGTFDPATGKLRVELLGLPPTFSFAVGFNPNVQKLASDDPSAALDIFEPAFDAVGTPRSTVDFWLVFDGTAIKLDAAKQVLAWARASATVYSGVGFKEPFLRKETIGDKGRWYLHLTTDGSYFGEGFAGDGGLFGRQYMSVGRVASPLTDPLGSGKASIAHEMFHAIFRAYRVPARFLCDNNNQKCRATSMGFNEGMATAAGYFIDQGSPAKPRPTERVRPLWWPFGWFDRAAPGTMYMNQDFYVYLLRVGTLANFRMHLEALAGTALPANGTLFDILAAYHAALDVGETGFGGNFTQTWAWYVADRGYARSPDGWLWPGEPTGGTPGDDYFLDPALWSVETLVALTADDCVSDADRIDCTLVRDDGWPLGAFVVSAMPDALGLPSALAGKPLTGRFGAFVSSGSVAFTVFGEKTRQGSAAASLRSAEGFDVSLENVGTDFPMVRMVVVPSGAASPRTMVELSFAGATEAKVWVLCEGVAGTKETYGCIPWDGDTTFSSASDECLFSPGDYLTSIGEFPTRAACAQKCVSTAEATSWRECKTPS